MRISLPIDGGGNDAFVAVLNPAGNALEWSTYLGSAYDDWAIALALDPSGNVYVTGITWDWSTFPGIAQHSGEHSMQDEF